VNAALDISSAFATHIYSVCHDVDIAIGVSGWRDEMRDHLESECSEEVKFRRLLLLQ